MTIYRKIYEKNFGPIPIDDMGRTYEIHHRDGNRANNDINNLQCISIQEHYDIHLSQNDYAASLMIKNRMEISPEEKSKAATDFNINRMKDKSHPFLRPEVRKKNLEAQNRMLLDGTHPFLDSENQSRKAKKASMERISNGTHHFCDSEFHRKYALDRLEAGTHNFQTAPKVTCPHCGKIGRNGPMHQWHFDNCKQIKAKNSGQT